MDLIINYRIGRNCNTGPSLMVTSYCGLHQPSHLYATQIDFRET